MSVRSVLRRLDRTLTRRRAERRVLVDSRTALNYEMVAPVVRMMATDSRVEFAFTASEAPDHVRAIYRQAVPRARLVAPSVAMLQRWDVYLTSDFMWATLPRGAARVQMFHGVAGKYGFDAPTGSMRAWDALFFINERRLTNFVRCGAIDEGSPAARLVGMPKVDCLVDGSLARDEVLRANDLDPARPTVLYAPTWSPASSLNRIGADLVEQLVRMDVNVIVKLHDRSRDLRPMYSGGVDWPARLQPLLPARHARLAGAANIAPLLVAADVMVTDHSSAGFEFLLLDRPLVRIEIPELIAQAHIHPDYVQMLADASHTATDAATAVRAVELALADRGALSATRRAVALDLFHRPGTATARAAAALYEILELAVPAFVQARPADTSPWLRTA